MIRMARVMAVIGGAVLLVMMGVTVASVLLRALGSGGIRGDYEIVELGTAVAVFAFLPLTQITGAHARVTLWQSRRLDRMWRVVFAALLGVIVWRLGAGMVGKYHSGETSLLLKIPLWWAYALACLGGVGAVLAAVYTIFAGRDEQF